LGTTSCVSTYGLRNNPQNMAVLFALHQEFTWHENLLRLVEATSNISATRQPFVTTLSQRRAILEAPTLAVTLICRPDYECVRYHIRQIVADRTQEILDLAEINNVNERGNLIEQ